MGVRTLGMIRHRAKHRGEKHDETRRTTRRSREAELSPRPPPHPKEMGRINNVADPMTRAIRSSPETHEKRSSLFLLAQQSAGSQTQLMGGEPMETSRPTDDNGTTLTENGGKVLTAQMVLYPCSTMKNPIHLRNHIDGVEGRNENTRHPPIFSASLVDGREYFAHNRCWTLGLSTRLLSDSSILHPNAQYSSLKPAPP